MTKFVQGLEELSLSLSDKQLSQFKTFLNELMLWNKKYKLVGASGDELIVKHFLDSLAPWREFSTLEQCHVADIGSGAGFPGIPLAIIFPNLSFTLIERMGRRCNFLNNVITLLGLENTVSVIPRDIEDVHDSYDIVTFRAFRDIEEFLPQLLRITKDDGALYAYKGKIKTIEKELSVINNISEVIKINVPFLNEERHLVKIFKRKE